MSKLFDSAFELQICQSVDSGAVTVPELRRETGQILVHWRSTTKCIGYTKQTATRHHMTIWLHKNARKTKQLYEIVRHLAFCLS